MPMTLMLSFLRMRIRNKVQLLPYESATDFFTAGRVPDFKVNQNEETRE